MFAGHGANTVTPNQPAYVGFLGNNTSPLEGMNMERIAAGEYKIGQYSISKDDHDNNTWWLTCDEWDWSEDFETLRDAKAFVRGLAEKDPNT
jgi:hypothetical protein